MKLPSIYKDILGKPDVIDILDWPFDFVVCNSYLLSKDWPIVLSEELIVVAEDATGAAYTVFQNLDPDVSPVIFLTSEGQAGKVAENLNEFLAVMVALPYWRDLLKFSAGGQLEEMRKAIPFLDKEVLEEEPEIQTKIDVVTRALCLPEIDDPVQTLFNSVKSGMAIDIASDDGFSYESLFNTFSVSDNRSWQNQNG